MPSDYCIDRGDDCLSLAALVPLEISKSIQPLDRAVIEHRGEQCADDRPGVVAVIAFQ